MDRRAEPPRRDDGARRGSLQAPQTQPPRRRPLFPVPGGGRRRAALPLPHPKGARRLYVPANLPPAVLTFFSSLPSRNAANRPSLIQAPITFA